MLQKSLTTPSDVIIYDLEDSVPPSEADKTRARNNLANFLYDTTSRPSPERIAVRLNAVNTPFFQKDISQALKVPSIRTFVLPKVNSLDDLNSVSHEILSHCNFSGTKPIDSIRLVASIESARAILNLKDIAGWRSKHGSLLGGQLSGLLFAAEDYCADTSVIRTSSRRELLYTRSQIAITAKAFGLEAIDMVCVNYKDLDYLREECIDGRQLGFTGKQAIHPTQVDTIQSTFVPSAREILRAAKILHQMKKAHSSQKGAIGLAVEDGPTEMIDAPMIKQAENIIRVAQAAGLAIPEQTD
ncbi:hypothetical protein QCA50_014626 [Cerrena zonata]|uniref:HpcH/HpaI aldolase/citrate lyase domain-containing protein n=1 Tax=Cerrena zonata TaxID=2478898 RepID=A0AAW0FNK2_9APHY